MPRCYTLLPQHLLSASGHPCEGLLVILCILEHCFESIVCMVKVLKSVIHGGLVCLVAANLLGDNSLIQGTHLQDSTCGMIIYIKLIHTWGRPSSIWSQKQPPISSNPEPYDPQPDGSQEPWAQPGSQTTLKKRATKPLFMQNNDSVIPVTNYVMFFVSAWTKKVCVDFFKICLTEKICWRLFWRHPLVMSAEHFSSKMLKRLKEQGFSRKV